MKSDKNRNVDRFELGDFPREPVPSSDDLQALILKRARQLPQYGSSRLTSSSAAPRNWLYWYKKEFRTHALLAITFVLGLSLLAVDFGGMQPSPEAFSDNDLEWQELMLIEDDLLFAQL